MPTIKEKLMQELEHVESQALKKKNANLKALGIKPQEEYKPRALIAGPQPFKKYEDVIADFKKYQEEGTPAAYAKLIKKLSPADKRLALELFKVFSRREISPETRQFIKAVEKGLEMPIEQLDSLAQDQKKAASVRGLRDIEPGEVISFQQKLAPMNEHHAHSEDLLKRSIRRGEEKDQQRLVRREIEAANSMDIPRMVSPYMDRASQSLQEFIRENAPDNSDYIKSVRNQMEDQFINEDIPEINKHFASRGAFFSGARQAALQKAALNRNKAIAHEISKVRMHEKEHTMHNYHAHKEGNLRSAQLASQMLENQQAQRMRAAEALQNEDLQNRAVQREEASLISQLGNQKQQQEQNALNLKQREIEREAQEPYERINRKAALEAGLPYVSPQLSAYIPMPSPPNPLVAASSALNTLIGSQLSAQNRARGGSVRAKYAKGGNIGDAVSEWNQLRGHSDRASMPYENDLLNMAHEMRTNRIDPMGQYLMALGAHQMGNLREPGKGYALGTLEGIRAQNSAHMANRDSKEKATNLMHKISESRLYQQQVLQNFYDKKRSHEADERHHEDTIALHRDQLNETKRAHDMNHAESVRYHNMMDARAAEPSSFMTREEAKERGKANAEINVDVRKQLRASKQALKTTSEMKKILERTNTGPISALAGKIPAVGPYLQQFMGAGNPKDLNLLENNANRLALEKHAMLSGKAQSVGSLSALQSTKANVAKDQKANVEATEMDYQEALETYKKSKFIMDFQKKGYGDAVDALQAYEEMHTQSETPSEEGEESGYVWMMDPKTGEKARIPAEHVEEAKADGLVEAE